jgi:hypothetical protein
MEGCKENKEEQELIKDFTRRLWLGLALFSGLSVSCFLPFIELKFTLGITESHTI